MGVGEGENGFRLNFSNKKNIINSSYYYIICDLQKRNKKSRDDPKIFFRGRYVYLMTYLTHYILLNIF